MEAITSFKVAPYTFLSNMKKGMHIIYDNITFDCVEIAYQYAKCETAEDKQKMLAEKNPYKAKTLSHEIQKRADWNEVQLSIMRGLLEQKFHQEPFMSQLLATGDAHICEGNWWHDNFYGACTCAKCASKEKHNHLGKMLMEIRAEIMAESR